MDEGNMDGLWRGVVDDDDDGDDPLQIPRLGRVPERSFWCCFVESGGGSGAELLLEKRRIPRSF